jgi:hypothetical protein
VGPTQSASKTLTVSNGHTASSQVGWMVVRLGVGGSVVVEGNILPVAGGTEGIIVENSSGQDEIDPIDTSTTSSRSSSSRSSSSSSTASPTPYNTIVTLIFFSSLYAIGYSPGFIPCPLPFLGRTNFLGVISAPIIAIFILWASRRLGTTQIRHGIVGTGQF